MVRDRKTFLFFPVEIGLAHIVRPLAVAEALGRRGHRVIFALSKRKQKLFQSSQVEMIDIKSYMDNDVTIRIKLFSTYQFHEELVKQELKMIKQYKPDAIIVDFRISALAAGLITNTPTYFLSLGESLPEGARLPNPGLPKLIYRLLEPLIGPIYQLALTTYLKPLMTIVKEHKINISWRDWFRKVTFILPEPSFYFPPNAKDLKLHYVGPLSWDGFKSETPLWLKKINRDGKTIYLTFGGTGFDHDKLIDLSINLVKLGYRVVVSGGMIAEPEDFPKMKNLFVAKFLPGKLITKKVDLMVCHGGYGTMIEAIQNQTPVLVVPFNPDQIIHGARMEELGVGHCLFKITLKDLGEIFTFNWKHIEDKGKKLETASIVESVRDMLTHQAEYRKALVRFNELYSDSDGADGAADIIEAPFR